MENCNFSPGLDFIPYHSVYKKCYQNNNYTFRMNNNNNTQDATADFLSGTGFQVPSFGDEDFDLLSQVPSLMLPSEQHQQQQQHQQHQQQQGHVMQSDNNLFNNQNTSHQSQMINNQVTMASNTMSHDSNIFSNLGNTVNINPTFPPQNFYDPDINMSNTFQGNSPNYGGGNMFQNIAMTTGDAMFQGQSNTGQMVTAGQHQTVVTNPIYPVSGGVKQGSPVGLTTTSPPRESTSEDSDDSLPLAQLVSLKRQAANNEIKKSPINVSPPTNNSPPPAKKAKAPKRKKKKDPNEPQKPVSAYALFFRDTQAAIKGQNPSASFGEVSKIVAAMWDGLDPDHKNGYKKKTEMAKKEYLKQLAAYRASQVSLAAVEESSGNEQSPPYQQQQSMQISQGSPTLMGDNSQMITNKMEQMSPPQVINYSPPHHQQPTQPLQHYQPSPPIQQPSNISYQQQNQTNYSGINNSMCIRNGCGNNAITSPGWDEEYCSSECVVSHCRDVFTAWVATRQATSSFPVK